MGTVNPLGKSVEEFWENIKANKNGLSYVDQFDTENFPVKIVGAVKDFDCTQYIDKKEAKRMDRFTQFAVCASKQAIEMAGSDFKDVDPFKAGVIIGVGIGGDFEKCAYLAKKALCRNVSKRNPKARYAELEAKMLEKINRLGIGPQGFGGTQTCLAVNIEEAPTHIAGLPVSVNIGCHVTRHASGEI